MEIHIAAVLAMITIVVVGFLVMVNIGLYMAFDYIRWYETYPILATLGHILVSAGVVAFVFKFMVSIEE